MKNKKKVLIVEDDTQIADIYKMRLSGKGYEVDIAKDGEEGIKKIMSFNPDLILLDLMIPIKNGFDVLREIKADEDLKDIPVIILSNLGQGPDIERSKDLGAVDYLVKSDTSTKDTIDKIRKYLK